MCDSETSFLKMLQWPELRLGLDWGLGLCWAWGQGEFCLEWISCLLSC